jgi:hypothetical protein
LDQLVPNSNSSTSPVATPTAKFTPKSRIQNFVVRSHRASPVRYHTLSITAMSTSSPSVSGTKHQ